MMKFYYLTISHHIPCGVGFYNNYLLPEELLPSFQLNDFKVEYGSLPWYARINRKRKKIILPDNLVLISNLREYDYPVRSLSEYTYIITQEFMRCLEGMKTNILQIKPVKYMNGKTKNIISNRVYYAMTTDKLELEEVVNLKECKYEQVYGVDELLKMSILENCDYDLFDIKHETKCSLIVSEKFRQKANDLKLEYLEFLPVELTKLITTKEWMATEINSLPRYTPV
jgi:hypothetical protein